MFLSFAPMEGVTSCCFRRVHARLFPGADRYYSPFLAPGLEGKVKRGALRDILPENNQGVSVIPQILCNRPQPFIILAGELKAMGYTQVNLNAGCPSGTVVPKHKGAGMLADPEGFRFFLDEVCEKSPLAVSVKLRMGLSSTAEFPALFELLRPYPLREVIVHARDRQGFYRSRPDLKAFQALYASAPWPICYNGNLLDRESFERVSGACPGLERFMLGRGAAANPALFRIIKGGAPLEAEQLHEFVLELLEEFLRDGLQEGYALSRSKELWYYCSHMFPGGEREIRRLNKARSLADYRSALEALFASGLFDPDSRFPGEIPE